ncbi:Glutamyl-tRNA reductase [hydrothermal vent metagenome]|uniref:glutamyl-tRNA reductase n=1 Tax=hydrothermal vent metagenome TaxID=652676 RepID=A0A3B1CH93_9ZZZZ
MNLIALGVNHKTAPVEVREKLAFTSSDIGETIELMKAKAPEILEEVILSTCNRVEIYARVTDVRLGVEALKKFLCEYHEIDRDTLDKSTYLYLLEDAIEHLFKVSSSLDSMVVGEPQILGQVKDAYRAARELSATGSILNNLFERSFNVAKKVRTETAIAENAVSVSYAAVELAKKIFGDLSDKVVMLVGAGEMIEIAAKHLVAQGVDNIMVTNRTYERALEFARKLNGEAIGFDSFYEELNRCDIVITSTGAPRFIIRKELAAKVIQERHHRPMFFIDIAVPRDIEPSVNEIENCYLYDIDDLQNVVAANMVERDKEAKKAEKIVQSEVSQFLLWLDHLEVAPSIVALKEKAENIRKSELEKTLSKLNGLSNKDREAVDRLTSSIVNKVLHPPIVNVKKVAETKDGHTYLKAFRRLFDIGDGE